MLRDHEDVQPSRVDVAWDFLCHVELRPDDLAKGWAPHMEAAGIQGGISGHGGVNTCYVGSMKSERYVRVYRKDRQDSSYRYAFEGQGVMRVELVLKTTFSRPWWNLWRQDEQRGLAAAAEHVRQMTGDRVQAECGELPPLMLPDTIGEAAKLRQFLDQHGTTLAALDAAGVPVVEMACTMQRETKSRKRQSRYRQRLESLLDAGQFWTDS